MKCENILTPVQIATGLVFGEGLRWRDGTLYVSDMLGLKVLAFDEHGAQRLVADMPTKPNGMAFLPNGDHIISSMHDARLYRVTPQGLVLYADMRALFTGYVGDMVADASGRLYVDDVGARVFEGEQLRPGRIVAVEPDGSVSVAADQLMFPNGIVITGDGKTLIVSETFEQRLTAFDIVDGKLQNRRTMLDLTTLAPAGVKREDNARLVDGMAIDAEDGLWLSMLKGEEFVRIDAQGQVTDRVRLPGHECVACALGGADGRTLFMVATHVPGPNIFEEMTHRRTRSHIYSVRVDVPRGAGRP
ncbi:MAG: SMP-30/gluconolactonase/LRE family protein [Pseudomonadota bacterium]